MATSQFKLIAKRIKDRHEEINRRALIAVSRRIILKTPVDTGNARNGWVFSFSGSESPEDDALKAVVVAIEPMKIGQLGYFLSYVPYIMPLELGHSKQAPAGMVRLSVNQWDRIVQKAVREVRRSR